MLDLCDDVEDLRRQDAALHRARNWYALHPDPRDPDYRGNIDQPLVEEDE